ncbi:coiled-coil domain-containing protein 150 isoform X2 [Scleropages formosus]|uniref:coiled-coil domain-containing protein 150 isoform X2 n=1 Tax=Scleropages formosus TaxID=113540 RepID=UPI00087821AA|nr:coiled-coil domain-containing protein 150-like isoform X2 [Scleropages formosus]
MSRAVIRPLQVGVTPPETLSVLQQRLRMAEEQADELVRGMESLGVPCRQLPETLGSVQHPPPVTPAHAGHVLERCSCEALVSRVCRLESLMQTLKLSTFRLEAEKELSSTHSASLMEQLSVLQRESEEERQAARKEATRLQDRLHRACQDRTEALEKVKQLEEALEAAATSKVDVALEAEELKEVKLQMNGKLLELNELLSQEASRNSELKRSQGALLQRIRRMEKMIENERRQRELLQADCRTVRHKKREAEWQWHKEVARAQRLEEQCQQLQQQADIKESLISQLTGELKELLQENGRMLKDGEDLRASAHKTQALKAQLEMQCAELSTALRSTMMENVQLQTEHQASLKVEQHLREQDLLFDAARRSIQAEMKKAQSEKLSLQEALRSLQAEHAELQRSSIAALANTVTQRELLERTVDMLQGELNAAVVQGETLKREKESTQAEACVSISKLEAERSSLEARLTELKVGMLEEKNKVLVATLPEVDQVEALHMALELAGEDNKKLAQSLEQALLAYSKLQGRLCQAQEDQQDLMERGDTAERTGLKAELKKERDLRRRATQKVAEVKKALENALHTSDNLSVENRKLREKVYELEKVVSKQKARIAEQKSQLKQHLGSKAELWSTQRVKVLSQTGPSAGPVPVPESSPEPALEYPSEAAAGHLFLSCLIRTCCIPGSESYSICFIVICQHGNSFVTSQPQNEKCENLYHMYATCTVTKK